MSKYIVMVKTDDVIPISCEDCKLNNIEIIECNSKGEMIAEWIYQTDEGREIKCYKELELDVVVKNDMEND